MIVSTPTIRTSFFDFRSLFLSIKENYTYSNRNIINYLKSENNIVIYYTEIRSQSFFKCNDFSCPLWLLYCIPMF